MESNKPPLWPIIPQNISDQNFKGCTLSSIVERSSNNILGDANLSEVLRTKSVS